MRILYVCTYYHKAMIFRDSMNYLEKRGHQVIAFNAVAKNTVIDGKYRSIMDEKVIHKECFHRADRAFYHLKQKKIENAIMNNTDIDSFDIIHSHTLFNGGWAVYQIHKKYGIPYVVSVRNTDMNTFLRIPMFKSVAKRVVEHAGAIVFLSEVYRDKFLKICYSEHERDRLSRKCRVIPNGLEPFWLEHVGQVKERIHTPLELLCVGKIDKNKNMETVVRVVEKLNKHGIATHLTAIGQVVDSKIKNLLDNNQYVLTVPYLTKEKLINYYRNADIFVMPSFHESFGRVYVEAMTQGVPVIYTRGQGFDGTFPEGTVGYSVNANAEDEIETAVKNIMEHYQTISHNCISNCRVFNWVDITEQLENTYLRSVKCKDN